MLFRSEEIGEGADLFDIPGFGADFAYTVDGGDAGDIVTRCLFVGTGVSHLTHELAKLLRRCQQKIDNLFINSAERRDQ